MRNNCLICGRELNEKFRSFDGKCEACYLLDLQLNRILETKNGMKYLKKKIGSNCSNCRYSDHTDCTYCNVEGEEGKFVSEINNRFICRNYKKQTIYQSIKRMIFFKKQKIKSMKNIKRIQKNNDKFE